MIFFVKNDKYVSFINIIIVMVFLIFNISFIWFLVIELILIMLYLIFMIYRLYLRKKVKYNEIEIVKELYYKNFKYDNYSDVYENSDDFDSYIGEYKKLLGVVIINFLRMDNKLNIDNFDYIDMGLDELEKNKSGNKEREYNYRLVNSVVNIIKKYYNKNCYRKDNIKKNKKLCSYLAVLTIISFVILISYFVKKNIQMYSVISSIYILCLIIVNVILLINKEDKDDNIDYNDRKIIEEFKNKKFDKNSKIYKYFEFLQFDCEDFLNHNKIESYDEIIGKYEKYKNDKEYKKEIEESKKIIDILFKYYDKDGNYRRAK